MTFALTEITIHITRIFSPFFTFMQVAAFICFFQVGTLKILLSNDLFAISSTD